MVWLFKNSNFPFFWLIEFKKYDCTLMIIQNSSCSNVKLKICRDDIWNLEFQDHKNIALWVFCVQYNMGNRTPPIQESILWPNTWFNSSPPFWFHFRPQYFWGSIPCESLMWASLTWSLWIWFHFPNYSFIFDPMFLVF